MRKLDRMAEKLRATVGGQTDDPEHLLDVLIAAWEEMHREAKKTPLHELIDLCREQDLALDLSLYGPDEGQLPGSDDTHSTYLGGSRVTGHKGDPMDVIRAAVRARRDVALASRDSDLTGENR